MRQVVGGSHTGEETEARNAQSIGKDRHTRHRQDIVDAEGTQEGTLACHIGSSHDIVIAIVYAEVILHRLGSQERMIEILCLEDNKALINHLCIRSLKVVIAKIRHAYHRIQFTHYLNPFLHLCHIIVLPFQESANQEEVAQQEAIGEEQAEEVATAIISTQYLLQLRERRQSLCEFLLHLLAEFATESALRDETEHLRICHQLMTKFSTVAIYLVK